MRLMSPKSSIRKIGKAIGGLRRRTSKSGDCNRGNPKEAKISSRSECETLSSSLADNCSSLSRTDESYNDQFFRPSSSKSLPEAPPLQEVDHEDSPLVNQNEKRRDSLDRMDSWLFLSGANCLKDGFVSDDKSECSGIEELEEQEEADDSMEEEDGLAPLPSGVLDTAPNRGVPGDRRGRLQRDDSWFNMTVEPAGESPPSIQRLRKHRVNS